jgi:hypothetical protein
MAEWLKAAVLKTVKGESSSRVRIPLLPQEVKMSGLSGHFLFWKNIERDSNGGAGDPLGQRAASSVLMSGAN